MQRLTDAVSGLKLCGELSDLDTASRRFCAGRAVSGRAKCAVPIEGVCPAVIGL
jgi:hypothetical protein